MSHLFICPACGNNSSRFAEVSISSSRGERLWDRCSACGSFFDPESYDAQEEVFHTQHMPWGRAEYGQTLNQFKMRMYHSVLALLNRHCPPPATLLDAGCSFGGFLIEARKLGYNVLGFDIVPEAVKHVRSLDIPAEASFSLGDVKLIENSALDILTCLDCNCYWPNQPSELKYAFTKLKPGGYLAMRVVDKSWMLSFGLAIRKIAPTIGKKILTASVNDHRFSMPVRSLLKVIQSSQFEVIYASPCGAIHSDKTRWVVKLSFVLGFFVWATTGIFIAPGALILARKPL